MDFIKKYKYYIVGVVIVLVLLLAFYGIAKLLLPNSSSDLYGNRLDGIEEVKISNDTINKIKEEISANEAVSSVTYHLSGRIVNVTVDVKDGTDLVTATGFADKVLMNLSDEQKAYYDVQVFLTCKENAESEQYPYIGYKHKTSVGFKWNNHE